MVENEQYRVFEQMTRQRRFAEAAKILLEYCPVCNEEQIVAVLTAAYVESLRGFDFSKIKGPGSKSVENAIQRMRHPHHHDHPDKKERRNHNLSLKPKNAKDGRHKRRK